MLCETEIRNSFYVKNMNFDARQIKNKKFFINPWLKEGILQRLSY